MCHTQQIQSSIAELIINLDFKVLTGFLDEAESQKGKRYLMLSRFVAELLRLK